MSFACKICIAEHGLRGSDIASLPKTEQELFDHIEDVHGIPVRRPGETDQQAIARIAQKWKPKS